MVFARAGVSIHRFQRKNIFHRFEHFIYIGLFWNLLTCNFHVKSLTNWSFFVAKMELSEEVKVCRDFNVFSGAENGILKCISINPKASLLKNFNHNSAPLDREQEITW